MLTIGRLITTAADALFPPSDEPHRLGEQEMSVKANAVLNRLKAYTVKCGISRGRRDRLSRTLHGIWERASAGDLGHRRGRGAVPVSPDLRVLGELLAL
jgi:hypothetical protein